MLFSTMYSHLLNDHARNGYGHNCNHFSLFPFGALFWKTTIICIIVKKPKIIAAVVDK